jgi:hypothetical protein
MFVFQDKLVVVKMPGKIVKEMLENAVSKHPSLSGRFPMISGLRMTIDVARSPGDRVVEVVVGGKALDL